jgi:hypothetical protein
MRLNLRPGLHLLPALFALTLAALTGPVPAAPAQDKVVGIVWEIKFLNHNGNTKRDVIKRFRATPDGKIWSVLPPRAAEVPRVIGKWEGDDQKTTVTIDESIGRPNIDWVGKFEIVQTGKEPPAWKGTFTHQQKGRKVAAQIRQIVD